jgi:hypothetical protein
LLDARDVCERTLDGRLRSIAKNEQVGERADQRTVPGAQQARAPHATIGEDPGLDETLDLGVEVARVAACLAGEIGDARFPVSCSSTAARRRACVSLRSTGASIEAFRVIHT